MNDNKNNIILKLSSKNIIDIMNNDPEFKIEFTNGLVNNIANYFVRIESEEFKQQIIREVQDIIVGKVIEAKIGFVSSIANHTEGIKLQLGNTVRASIRSEVEAIIKDTMNEFVASGVKDALEKMKPGLEEFFDNSVRELAVITAVKNANDSVRQALEDLKRKK